MADRRPFSVEHSPLAQLILTRAREYYREPASVFWAFGFPVLLAVALGIAFKTRGPEPIAIAVEATADPSAGDALVATLRRASDGSLSARLLAPVAAREALRTGKVALVVVAPASPDQPYTYRADPTRPQSRLARALTDDALQSAAGRPQPLATRTDELLEPGSRYIDFLIPGLVGMNLMSSSMWGIGWAVVNTRTRRLLKRLAATPMRRRDFLLAHLITRLVFLPGEVAVVLVAGWLLFGVAVHGSLAALAVVSIAGTLAFSSLGLLVACRAQTIETASGLMNLAMLPMYMLSGVFFASSHFPEGLQPLIRALPLTALNDALRALVVDGASLRDVARELAILSAWGIGAFSAAVRLFRWS